MRQIRCVAVAMMILLLAGSAATAECRSANVVVHGASTGRAKLIAEHAERVRRDAFVQLLGDDAPRPWHERCAIHVHATPDSFAEAVGGSPASARGATSLEFSGPRITSRRIDVMGDGADVVPDALAHELVHVVLADHFVHAAPPRWADEGLALLFDSSEKQRKHETDFRSAQSRGLVFSSGLATALKRHYDLDSVSFLDSAWKEVPPIQTLTFVDRK
jgi:hypothetical protein